MTGRLGSRIRLPFPTARELARSLGVTSQAHWHRYRVQNPSICKHLPHSPHAYYKKEGFQGYSDFFGFTHYFADATAVSSRKLRCGIHGREGIAM